MSEYKLVPVEPTEEMLRAGRHARFEESGTKQIYRVMLAAAPDAPAVQAEPHPPSRHCGCHGCAPSFEDSEPPHVMSSFEGGIRMLMQAAGKDQSCADAIVNKAVQAEPVGYAVMVDYNGNGKWVRFGDLHCTERSADAVAAKYPQDGTIRVLPVYTHPPADTTTMPDWVVIQLFDVAGLLKDVADNMPSGDERWVDISNSAIQIAACARTIRRHLSASNPPAADPVADKLAEALRKIVELDAPHGNRAAFQAQIARAALAEWEQQKGGGE